MKVLHITNHLNIGGITSYVYSLGCGFKKNGHDVYVASQGGVLSQKFTEAGVKFIPLPLKTKSVISPKLLICRLKLIRFIRENNIDLIHTHSRTTRALGCFLSKYTGVKHIFTCHGFFPQRLSRIFFPSWGDIIIAISHPVREHLIRDFGLDREKIFVVHNGIDASRFKVARKTENKGTVGIVARLSDVKGHIYLIEAMGEVLTEFPDARLMIIGDGKTKDELVKLVEKLGIGGNVIFLPSVQDTAEALSKMDIFVLPSLKEGLGLSLMEAMASGLAVVGSNIGGIKSLIQDNYNGLLVEPKDSTGLSQAILQLLRDKQKRDYLGANAAKFIADNFSLDDMVAKTEEVYRRCLSVKSWV